MIGDDTAEIVGGNIVRFVDQKHALFRDHDLGDLNARIDLVNAVSVEIGNIVAVGQRDDPSAVRRYGNEPLSAADTG